MPLIPWQRAAGHFARTATHTGIRQGQDTCCLMAGELAARGSSSHLKPKQGLTSRLGAVLDQPAACNINLILAMRLQIITKVVETFQPRHVHQMFLVTAAVRRAEPLTCVIFNFYVVGHSSTR